MIEIKTLQSYYTEDKVLMTQHSSERCRQRGIKIKDIRHAIMDGEIIEQYPDDYPFPSCLIFGYSVDNKIIHVVMRDEGQAVGSSPHISLIRKNGNLIIKQERRL